MAFLTRSASGHELVRSIPSRVAVCLSLRRNLVAAEKMDESASPAEVKSSL